MLGFCTTKPSTTGDNTPCWRFLKKYHLIISCHIAHVTTVQTKILTNSKTSEHFKLGHLSTKKSPRKNK